MEKIKIIRIITRLNIGGPAQHVIFLSQALNEGNFETLLIAGRPQKDEGDMSFLAKSRAIRIEMIPQMSRELDLINDIIAFFKIFLIIFKEKPDIIHTHTAKAGTLGRLGGILYNVFRKNRAKLIHTFHGHVLEGYFGTFKTKLFVFIERILANFTDIIISVSEASRRDLLRLRIGRNEKIKVIRLGLELDRFLTLDGQRKLRLSDAYRIGIIGRLVPIKNHKLFLEAARLFTTRYPNLSVKFIIVGDGELNKDLRTQANELNLGQLVEFIGWQKDLREVYANLDIVCLTSLNEGTPLSLIEAMSAAKAIVATDVGGVREVLDSAGILVESGDVLALAEAFKILLENDSLRVKMGQQAREVVRENFTKERLVSDIKKLYLSLFLPT
jgi:glycosyltransferase involved in cell wall biosynthesis